MSIKDIVAEAKIMDGLSAEDVGEIISISQEETFKEDDSIFKEDATGNNLYIVLEGSVKVEIQNYSFHLYRGDKRHLTTLGRGEVFGEITFLGGGRRTAGVTSMENVRLMNIDGVKLYALCRKNYRLGYLMMRNIGSILAKRLSEINFKYRDNR
jgi:CRP/FNR family transcriptional regulator